MEETRIEEQLTRRRSSLAAQEASAATLQPWWRRIEQLQQRLAASPEENIPELKLLGMKDWIEAVLYAETATEGEVRVVFAALRSRARTRFASQLAAALKKFCDASGGELPANVQDLLPHLAPPADAAMLSPYQLVRTGKLGALDEVLLTSTPTESSTKLNITAQGFSWNATTDDIGHAPRVLDAVSGDFLDGTAGVDRVNVGNFARSLEALGPAMEAAMEASGDVFGEEFGARLKPAVKQFALVHGHLPPDMAALGDALPEREKIVALATRMVAEFQFRLDHEGAGPAGPVALQPYLEANGSADQLLRLLKLKVEGDSVTMSFSFGAQ